MRNVLRGIGLVVLGGSLLGQTVLVQSMLGQTPLPVSTTKEAPVPAPAPAASTTLAPQKAAPAQIAADTPIVTLEGVCEESSKAVAPKKVAAKAGVAKPKTCRTVITRAQMDAIADLLVPDATPEQRHQFALNYIRVMAASSVALDKRLDHDPAVAQEMDTRVQFTRMQVMASSLYRRVEKLSEDVQDSELQSYYTQHADDFVRGEVQRIVLMKTNASGAPVDAGPLKVKADELHARAAKGEDFAALQKEAAAMNPAASAAWLRTANVNRRGLPPGEAVVFDLKPGEITGVLDGPGAFEIVKLVSLDTVPLESVRKELTTALTNGHLQLLMKDATKGVTANFNLAYLGLPSAPELFLSPSLRGPNGGRPAGPGLAQGPGGMPKRPTERPRGFPVVPNATTLPNATTQPKQ